EAGGQSLTAIRLLAKLETSFKVTLPLQTLFETPTVESLSNRICDLTGGVHAPRAASTYTERQLATIWRRVLGVQEITVDRSFFELQGARDLLDPMLAEVRRSFFILAEGLPVKAFLQEPTIAALARIIDGRSERSSSLLVCLQPSG